MSLKNCNSQYQVLTHFIMSYILQKLLEPASWICEVMCRARLFELPNSQTLCPYSDARISVSASIRFKFWIYRQRREEERAPTERDEGGLERRKYFTVELQPLSLCDQRGLNVSHESLKESLLNFCSSLLSLVVVAIVVGVFVVIVEFTSFF